MSVFDLFRGFFGRPGGYYRGDERREPFFDGLTHEEEDDEAEDVFDDVFRFGFSFGPNGMRIQEPPVFGRILQEMEDMFSGLDHFHRDLPSIEAPPQKHPGANSGGGRIRSGDCLRDFMLKTPVDPDDKSTPRDLDPSSPRVPSVPSIPFHHWTPFSRFKDIWKDGPGPRTKEKKEDGGRLPKRTLTRHLDSQVSLSGLDQILTPAPTQPKTSSFFQSVTVTKVVKPDGTVEERRTVRDGQGNEETTVTRSGGPSAKEDPHGQPAPLKPGASLPFSDLHEFSFFSKLFGGFRG